MREGRDFTVRAGFAAPVFVGDGPAIHLAGAAAHQVLKFAEMPLVNGARGGVVFRAQAGGHADDLAHGAAGAHHAHRAERIVGDADVAPGHEEVGDVARVEAAIGNPKRTVGHGCGKLDVVGDGDEGIPLEALVIFRIRAVQVIVPARGSASVGKLAVVLRDPRS